MIARALQLQLFSLSAFQRCRARCRPWSVALHKAQDLRRQTLILLLDHPFGEASSARSCIIASNERLNWTALTFAAGAGQAGASRRTGQSHLRSIPRKWLQRPSDQPGRTSNLRGQRQSFRSASACAHAFGWVEGCAALGVKRSLHFPAEVPCPARHSRWNWTTPHQEALAP